MEPEEQPINPNDLIIFKNIDNEDHEWQYDAIKTPLPYYIRAGETRELPYYIARHGIEKLIDKIIMKQGKLHTNSILRNELREKIFLGLKHINFIREKTPNELALEAMQRKKDSDPYKELIKKREIEAEQTVKAQEAIPTIPLFETKGMVSSPVVPQDPNTANTNSPIAQSEATFDPSRENVYNLLRTKLHLDLSHKQTKEALDAKSVDALREEFKDQLPELSNPDAALVPDSKDLLSSDGMPVKPTTPVLSTPPPTPPPTPPAPSISMNPQAPAAPILDQQLKA